MKPQPRFGSLSPDAHAVRRTGVIVAILFVLLALCFRTVIRGDGVGYYAYLPAVVGHGSLNLEPTFERFLQAGVPVQAEFLQIRLGTGFTADYKQVGSALLALPFYAVATVVLGITPQTEDPALDPTYQFAFTAAALFYALFALFLLYRFMRFYWARWSSRLALIAVAFGTPLVAYIFFEPSYSHAFSVAAIIAFALFLYVTGPGRLSWQWFLLGLLGGVVAITHIQESLYVALIPAEALWLIWSRRWKWKLAGGYAIALTGFAIALLPQVVVDRVIFGGWLPASAPNLSFDFWHPHLLDLLVSTHHGWLAWSPLVVVGLLGLPLVVRRFGWFAIALIAIGIGELWINAALSDWWGGLGFGARRLTDQTLLLALSYAALFDWARSRIPAAVVAAVTAGVAWTVLLLAQFYYVIRVDAGPSWPDFLLGQLRAIQYVPRLFIQGGVIRELATGQLLAGALTAGVLAILLGGALFLSPWLPLRQANATLMK